VNPQQATQAIVLARTDYGEADRIVTLITPEAGKLRLIAKGVRKIKSKLAGGIELFSVADITYLKGRGEVGTLVSARLRTHYGHIVQDINRTMLGYELIKHMARSTEDEPEPHYFHLLEQSFAALDDSTLPIDLVRLWFSAQLLRLSGHTPNLQTEMNGTKLEVGKTYEFSFDDSSFMARPEGPYDADAIKFLRLLFAGNQPAALVNIEGFGTLVERVSPLVNFMSQQYIH
jgi:DNA repair protein RecO